MSKEDRNNLPFDEVFKGADEMEKDGKSSYDHQDYHQAVTK